LRLGSLLNNKELSDWAKSEAGGYESRDSLPDYRIVDTDVRGTFSGSYGSGLDNAPIPKFFIEEEHRDMLFKVYMMQSVGELERLVSGSTDTNSITIPWAGDVILRYQQKAIYRDCILVAAWKVMTATHIAGVLEVIRTRVLEFVLVIEKELGIDMMNDDSKTPVETPSQTKRLGLPLTGACDAFQPTLTSTLTRRFLSTYVTHNTVVTSSRWLHAGSIS
jgi:hypothetical protein